MPLIPSLWVFKQEKSNISPVLPHITLLIYTLLRHDQEDFLSPSFDTHKGAQCWLVLLSKELTLHSTGEGQGKIFLKLTHS